MTPSGNPLHGILGERPLPARLTQAEEIELAQQVRTGRQAERRLHRRALTPRRRQALRQQADAGQAAREALVLHNLPLVVSVAGRFRYSSLSYDDLIQEGVLGLIKAAERFDPARGTRFGTLAVWWIRQSIGRAVANTGRAIRLPVNRAWKLGQLRRYAAQLAQTNGDEPPLAQVAAMAGVSAETATDLLREGQGVVSLDAPADPDDRAALERVADDGAADPEHAVVQSSLTAALEEALGRLEEREAQILRMRFGLGGGEARPLRAIAAEWRMSPEGVRQITERAIGRLRGMSAVRALNVYLED